MFEVLSLGSIFLPGSQRVCLRARALDVSVMIMQQPQFSAGFNFSLWGGATILQRLQGFCFCKLIRIETLAWHSISDCYLQTVVEIQDPPDVFNAVLYYPLLPVKE